MREKLHSIVALWILCFYIFPSFLLSCCLFRYVNIFFFNLDLNPASGVTSSKFVKWGGISQRGGEVSGK